ncbi:MAG: RHS repeat-associated core domain-containing protein, partial [Clostridia bacterium]|nr:RHS repeat-associated core domain-containing protein [Clostridia bacterium]
SYYYDTETGFYYLHSRYYDPAIRRFINADGYLNANGDILGFNMYAYCGNNPVSYADYTGEDAIYVVDYSLKTGLPIVGHAKLYLEDKDGNWHMTEYGFDKNNKIDGLAIVNFWGVNDDTISKMKNFESLDNIDYVYIEGDFTNCFDVVNKYNNTDYGGYNLITNNCLHYVKEVLSAGDFRGTVIPKYAQSGTIIPREYYSKLQQGQEIDKEYQHQAALISKSHTYTILSFR